MDAFVHGMFAARRLTNDTISFRNFNDSNEANFSHIRKAQRRAEGTGKRSLPAVPWNEGFGVTVGNTRNVAS